jgi:PAS domain S-box-containing protein
MKKSDLKTWILIPAAALLCVLFTGFLYGVWSLQDYHLRKDFSSCLKSSETILKDHSEADIKVLSTVLEVLCRDEKLQASWRRHDRAALEASSKSLFKDIREKYKVTHFYFHELNRICFLRVHQPDRYGDLIERQTLVQSQKSGDIGAGIELGPLGTLTLRVVKPWVIDDRVEGYLELGEEIGEINKEIARELGVDVAVLIDKTYLDREGWESGMALHDRSTNWDDLPKEVVLECHPAGITPGMLGKISAYSDNASKNAMALEIRGVPYMAGSNRLFDFSGRIVGRMVIFDNISQQRASLDALMFKLAGFFIVTAAICLLGAFAYLNHVERLLNRSQERVLRAVTGRETDQARHIEEMLQFRKALEGATDAIAILGLDRQLLFINPAFERLFGYTLEEANARGGTKKLYSDQKLGVKAYLMVSQGRTFSGEMEMLTRDNRGVRVFLRASPIINYGGDMFGILAIYTDINVYKTAERELQKQAAALVESN